MCGIEAKRKARKAAHAIESAVYLAIVLAIEKYKIDSLLLWSFSLYNRSIRDPSVMVKKKFLVQNESFDV